MNREFVNAYLEITESYKMPERMMEILFNPAERVKMFDAFIAEDTDLSVDQWTDYFQEEQGDRNALKQDLTPPRICQIVAEITPEAESYADVCAGTGGLTIGLHARFPDAYYHCEEVSERIIPILLFNLAIRNINAEVIHGDSLEQTVEHCYRITPGERYSDIQEVESVKPRTFGEVVSNPPYSLAWNPDWHNDDKRFTGYELAPKSKADYAFILHGMSLTEGVSTFILPHGVLFRGQKEGKIRKQLAEEKRIKTIIGLPNNMFRNTGIPVLIMQMEDKSEDVLIVDAADQCEKDGKYNRMDSGHIRTVLDAVQGRKEVDKLATVTSLADIEKNDYNLNIPRYVDKYEPEPVPDIVELMEKLAKLEKEIEKEQKEFFGMLNMLNGTTKERAREMHEVKRIINNGQYQFEFPEL